jgi:hypothetical protein
MRMAGARTDSMGQTIVGPGSAIAAATALDSMAVMAQGIAAGMPRDVTRPHIAAARAIMAAAQHFTAGEPLVEDLAAGTRLPRLMAAVVGSTAAVAMVAADVGRRS